MEQKNNAAMYSIVFLVVGIVLGWLVWGSSMGGRMMNRDASSDMHASMAMDMSGAMGSMMSGLEGKTGDDFDKAFLTEMVVHHEGAVAMAQAALQNAKHEEIRTMAKAIISAQTGEIQQMKDWQKAWYAAN